MSLSFNMCGQLSVHVDMQARGSSPTCGEPTYDFDDTGLQCVKHLCVCRGSLQLCRRPCIIHASTLLSQLWSQPWAEAGALPHAAAHFKGWQRNWAAAGETMNEWRNRWIPTTECEKVKKKEALVSVWHIWLTSNYPSLPTAVNEEAPAPCGEGLVRLTRVYLLLLGKGAKELHQQQRRWEKKQEARAPQELDWLNEALCYLNGKSMFAFSKGTIETGSERERYIAGVATIWTH